MAKNGYLNGCIKEIRQSVYGRDGRKPIADSLEQVNKIIDRDPVTIYYQNFIDVGVVANASSGVENDYTLVINP